MTFEFLKWLNAVELAGERADSSNLVALLRDENMLITPKVRELLADLFDSRKFHPVPALNEAEWNLIYAAQDYRELRRGGQLDEDLLKIREEVLNDEVRKLRRAGERVTLDELRNRTITSDQAVQLAARHHQVDEGVLRDQIVAQHGGKYERLKPYLDRLRP